MAEESREWQEDLSNIAYDESYIKAFRDFCREVEADGEPDSESNYELEYGYFVKCRSYIKHLDEFKVKQSSQWSLFTKDGKEKFSFKAAECTLHTVIEISGKRYFIYNDNLYGYNVLRLDDMSEFRYFPRTSASCGAYPIGEDYVETFIWTELSYNPQNSFMAVHGCYWAGPYEIMLYKIEDIMKPITEICYPLDFVGCDYYDTETVNPFAWSGTDLIINYCEKILDGEDCPSGRFTVSEEKYTTNAHSVKI